MLSFKNFFIEEDAGSDKKDLLQLVGPSSIFDNSLTEKHIPFIYIENDEQKLYIAPTKANHYDIFTYYDKTHSAPMPLELEDKLMRVYMRNFSESGCFGRIGYQLTHTWLNYKKIPLPEDFRPDVVTIYDLPPATPKVVHGCLTKLKEKGLINDNTYVVYGGNVKKLGDAMPSTAKPSATKPLAKKPLATKPVPKKAAKKVIPQAAASDIVKEPAISMPQASKEQQEKAMLQVALHTGSWPDGKFVTPEEKRRIQEILGMINLDKPKGWQTEFEKLTGKKGVKWWAQTSENKFN